MGRLQIVIIVLYQAAGRVVVNLRQSQVFTETWDQRRNDGQLVNPGRYVIEGMKDLLFTTFFLL